MELRGFEPSCDGVGATPRRAISAANFGASPSVFTTSSTNAFASLWRRKGSLNRHFPISVSMALSMFALIAFGFGGCSSTIFAAISAAFLPWYAGRPVAISKSTRPSEKMSVCTVVG